MTAKHRHSIRLSGYDYTSPGAYFVTLCAQQGECLFGRDRQRPNGAERNRSNHRRLPGLTCLNTTGDWKTDAFAVMPNHMHGVIILSAPDTIAGAKHSDGITTAVGMLRPYNGIPQRAAGTTSGSLNAIIQNFKSVSTRRANQWRNTPGAPIWQRNYYEHVVRNVQELERIRQYIANNPLRWALDEENPETRKHHR